ncbi:Rho GTPase-activating protein 32 [Halocaridina rubra]|uniref:Rho GTPase-activating protein 32 n=1 Tax=Halocaridina rubra TaxID=373956 RepID=A0AAN8WGQ2_HALRR
MYFRELPNPLLTYQLYEKFVAAVMQDEDVRLLYLRDVVQQLPPPHYRTLEYLVQHLARIAAHSPDTGMTPKNIAIVWAPNLLRSKDLDNGGVAALQDVGTQAVVTEYLVRYVDLIFNDKIPTFYHSTNGVEGTPKKSRPKSLAISTPTKLLSIEEARTRALNPAIKPDQKYIEVGGGPHNLPPKYHTVIELPNRKGGSLKQKKSPSGWKSIFSKGRSMHKHQRKASTPSDVHLNISDSVVTETDIAPSSSKRLRPVKSVESLVSTSASLQSNRNSQALDSPGRLDGLNFDSPERSANLERESRSSSLSSPIPSPRTHNRSVSHDSYFNTLESQLNNLPSQIPVKEEAESDLDFSPNNSRINLDISELDLNFSTSEKDLKGFEVDTLKSTSVEDPEDMSASTLDMENLSMCSDGARSKENVSPRPEKKSLKEKFRNRFTSPPSQRRGDPGISDSSEDSCNNSLKRASASLKDKIVYALSPETTRRRSDASPKSCSPSSSPKLKHVRTADSSSKSQQALTGKLDNFITNHTSAEKEGNIETVLAEIHVEPGSRESGDTPSRQSMDSALIDPELLDKITHLRTSPSASASESSRTSAGEAVSDNEIFSIGTLGSSYSGIVFGTGSDRKEIIGDQSSTEAISSENIIACTHPVTIIADNTELREGCSVTPMDEDVTPLQEFPKARPNSLLGLPTSELLTLGSALTSPETPQGDSTFLEIQYHPLSDTTEPSTPSESQFVQDLVAGGHMVPHPPAADEPRQSSPLSIDLSSSDEPTEDGPVYENVEMTTSIQRESMEYHYDEPLPLSSPASMQSSQASFHISQSGTEALLEESQVQESLAEYENYICGTEYENIRYGAEYENVEFSSEYQGIDAVPSDITIDLESAVVVQEESINNEGVDVGTSGEHYENVSHVENEGMNVDMYENVELSVKEPLPVYENLEEHPEKQEHNAPETDDAYEEYSFSEQPQYENIKFKSQASADMEGEMVYQQVKFLRKSIQEVNEMLKVNGEKRTTTESCDNAVSDSDRVKLLHTLVNPSNVIGNSSELPIQVPHLGDTAVVPQTCESLPCSKDVSQPIDIAIDSECAQPCEDNECLDSPVTPSSTSLATEVLVLPSFASPTESTTDDVTSPVSSDDGSSPKPIQEHHGPCVSPAAVPPILPSLSPPTPECVPVPPAATSTPNRTLTSIITPAPWPRTSSRHAPIAAPVPRPRQLPKLNLSSPLVSPVSTPSSISISPDSPATPGTPSGSSDQGTPTENAPGFQAFQPSHSTVAIHSQNTDSDQVTTCYSNSNSTSASIVEINAGRRFSGSKVSLEAMDQDAKTSVEKKALPSSLPPSLQRFKTSPDFRLASTATEVSDLTQGNVAKENEDNSATVISTGSVSDSDDPLKRERIEKYKEERRSFLREKYKSDSFRGEKDEMLMRLKQKATSPSRPEGEEEMIQSSNSRSLSPQRRGSSSPTKQIIDAYEGRISPDKNVIGERHSLDYHANVDKKEEEEGEVFRRSSPVRRSLNDVDRVGHLKNPSRTRLSSAGPTFQRSTSSGSTRNSSGNNTKPPEVVNARSSLRKSPDKEVVLRRSCSTEAKSDLSRKVSSPTSPVKSTADASPFQRSASIGCRRKFSDDVDEDVNVKERVAIWSAGKARDASQSKENASPKIDKSKTDKPMNKKQEIKPVKEPVVRKNSVPLSPTRKTSLTKVTPSSPGIPRTTPPSPGLPKANPFPPTHQKISGSTPQKNSVKCVSSESNSDTSITGGNVSVRGNSGQQRRIRDMAAIFERDSAASAKPVLLRQTSREDKKERY